MNKYFYYLLLLFLHLTALRAPGQIQPRPGPFPPPRNPITTQPAAGLLSNGVYLLLETPHPHQELPSLDCSKETLSATQLAAKLDQSLSSLQRQLQGPAWQNSFYVGKVSSQHFTQRNLSVRIREHNRKVPVSQARLYRFLRDHPQTQLQAYALLFNCPRAVVKAMETHLIRFLGANHSPLGLNSNIGNARAHDQLLGPPLRTPLKERKKVQLIVTPRSRQTRKVVYVIHDHDSPLFQQKKIDLRNEKLTEDRTQQLTVQLQGMAHEMQQLHFAQGTHGLYIGLAQNTEQRSHEHTQEAYYKAHHTRKTYWLNECAKSDIQLYHEATILNIHPSDIQNIEAILIKLTGANEDYGKNSNSGTLPRNGAGAGTGAGTGIKPRPLWP